MQILTAFGSRARTENKPLNVATIEEYFKEFENSSVVEAKKFTPAEMKVTKWLFGLCPDARKIVEYHWSIYKVAESAIPLNAVEAFLDAENAAPREPANKLWAKIYTQTPEKVEAWLMRRIGIFQSKVKAEACSCLLARCICALIVYLFALLSMFCPNSTI